MPPKSSLMTLDKVLRLLQAIGDISGHAIIAFVGNETSASLVTAYDARRKTRDIDVGFNLFVIISDIYHKENFHSDILTRLIDPRGTHQEKDRYLQLFLE